MDATNHTNACRSTSDAETQNVRMVTDLRFCTTNMAMQAISMSASLVEGYKALPLPLQRVMAMTTVFRFCQRPATLYDDPNDEYSRDARFLLGLLKQKNLFSGVHPSDMIGLKCGYCHNNDGIHLPGCVSFIALGKHYKREKDVLSVSLQQRINHLSSCLSACAYQTQNLSHLLALHCTVEATAKATCRKLEDDWLRFIQRVPFDLFPSGKTSIHLQPNVNYIRQVGEQYWADTYAQLHQVYNHELDFLEKFMFCGELFVPESETNRLAEIDSVPSVDIFVPLDYRHIADCKHDKDFYEEEDVSSSYTSRKRSWHEVQASTSASVQLHGKIGIHDVVMPKKGCSLGVVRAVYNLGCNRRFMKLVSKHRQECAVLTTEEGKAMVAREIMRTIENGRGGTFRSVSCRDVDGAAIVSKIPLDSEALAYIHNRLENGFPDVFNICAKEDVQIRMFAETPNSAPVYVNKAVAVEHVPQVGLLWGDLTWRSRPYDGVTLGDLKEGNKLQPLHFHASSASDDEHKLSLDVDSVQWNGDGMMPEEYNLNSPEEDPETRKLSSSSAVTMVSEENEHSMSETESNKEISAGLSMNAPCVSVEERNDSM